MSIYFLRFNDLIKIGYSSNLERRVASLIAAIPGEVQFLGHMPGDREVEAHLHHLFEVHRFSGEWFLATPELQRLAELVLTPGKPTPEMVPSARRLNDNDAWQEMQTRVRSHAAHLWPEHNHGERKRLLAELLGWGTRRARSLYDEFSGHTLRQTEREQLDELFFARGQALTVAAQQINADTTQEGDDE